ncbi:hypothetical protein KI387_035572, partial [Taxus chinensis]
MLHVFDKITDTTSDKLANLLIQHDLSLPQRKIKSEKSHVADSNRDLVAQTQIDLRIQEWVEVSEEVGFKVEADAKVIIVKTIVINITTIIVVIIVIPRVEVEAKKEVEIKGVDPTLNATDVADHEQNELGNIIVESVFIVLEDFAHIAYMELETRGEFTD